MDFSEFTSSGFLDFAIPVRLLIRAITETIKNVYKQQTHTKQEKIKRGDAESPNDLKRERQMRESGRV